MTPLPAIALATLVALSGCAALAHQATDSFERTRALAGADDPDAQLDLARMYANPAAWPQANGVAPNPVLAAAWCTIAAGDPPPSPAALARGPSCPQLLASLPPDAVNSGEHLALDWREAPTLDDR